MTPHFSDEELRCKCGCGGLPELGFMLKIERLRVEFGKPMTVTSAYRCPDYNEKVSSTGRNGPHTTGRAIDIAVERADAFELIMAVGRTDYALGLGITGIGVQQKGGGRFIHLDDLTEGRPTIWSY